MLQGWAEDVDSEGAGSYSAIGRSRSSAKPRRRCDSAPDKSQAPPSVMMIYLAKLSSTSSRSPSIARTVRGLPSAISRTFLSNRQWSARDA
jgi:hypothetical protein